MGGGEGLTGVFTVYRDNGMRKMITMPHKGLEESGVGCGCLSRLHPVG